MNSILQILLNSPEIQEIFIFKKEEDNYIPSRGKIINFKYLIILD